ncbi:MAG: antibiotic biosynthesis monooxygenase [Bacillota bacterium]|nr:antibiotic biosynthesis monooxygenase [Bacillota bacterium]
MFINIINFPPVKAGKDDAFQNWFSWSNKQYATHKGFISRKLLKPREGGNYIGLVEHETYDTFMAMHTSSTQAEARKRVEPLLEGNPAPHFYELVLS